MKNHVKVKEIETYTDSQGEHIVCKGKLVLIPTNDHPIIGDIIHHPDRNRLAIIENLAMCETATQLSLSILKPIIISETEGTEDGDLCYDKQENRVINNQYLERSSDNRRKVLALPENFSPLSPKHIQAIVDGKLKDGDEVYVECQEFSTPLELLHSREELSKEYGEEILKDLGPIQYIIKLNSYNHIKLFPIQESWYDIFGYTQKQINDMKGDLECHMAFEIMRDLIDNYNPPKRKTS